MDCDVRYKYMHTSDEWNGGGEEWGCCTHSHTDETYLTLLVEKERESLRNLTKEHINS